MGIRFACHVCDKRLNIKQELAGKRGVCPACSARIRIPLADTEKSTPVEVKQPAPVAVESSRAETSHAQVSDLAGDLLGDAAATGAAVMDVGDNVPAQPSLLADESPADDLPDHDPDATWYVRPPSGGQYGPATTDVLRQWIGEGRVATNALLWRDGWPQWREALEVFPELTGQLPQGSGQLPQGSNGKADVHVATRLPQQSRDRSEMSGEVDLGAERRSRWVRRMMAIGMLSTLAITLIVVLVIVATRS